MDVSKEPGTDVAQARREMASGPGSAGWLQTGRPGSGGGDGWHPDTGSSVVYPARESLAVMFDRLRDAAAAHDAETAAVRAIGAPD